VPREGQPAIPKIDPADQWLGDGTSRSRTKVKKAHSTAEAATTHLAARGTMRMSSMAARPIYSIAMDWNASCTMGSGRTPLYMKMVELGICEG
jgi:hypothetical protein